MSLTDQLRELSSLLELGALTEDEFAAAKSAVISAASKGDIEAGDGTPMGSADAGPSGAERGDPTDDNNPPAGSPDDDELSDKWQSFTADGRAAQPRPTFLEKMGLAQGTVGREAPGLPADPQASDRWVWMLVAAPAAATFIAALSVPYGGSVDIGTIDIAAALALNTVLVWLDWREIRTRNTGYSLLWLGALLVPAYLWRRGLLLARGPKYAVAWAVVFLFSISGVASDLAANLAGNEIDPPVVEEAIQDWVRNDLGLGESRVECPAGIPARRGERFDCVVSAGGESVVVEVRVQNNSGDVVWEVR